MTGRRDGVTNEKEKPEGKWGQALKKFSIFVPIVMLPVGCWLGYRAFEGRPFSEILGAIGDIPGIQLILAFACAGASYICLSGFDALAVHYVGRPLAYWKIALTSFVSLSIGHNVGVAALSSGAIRYRFYSGFGLSAGDVGKIILFCGLTVGLGLMTLGGLVLILRPTLELGTFALSPAMARAAGTLCLALSCAYVVLAWRRKDPVTVRGHTFRLPGARMAAAQVALGTVNFAFVAATLHQLLAGAASLPDTVSAYVLANVTGLVSHVPGGLGVLEFVISSLISQGNVIGALLAFRIVYFLVPLMCGITLLVVSEFVRWRKR